MKYIHLFMYLGDRFTTNMLGSEGVVASYHGWGWIAAGSLNSFPSYTIHLHPPPTPLQSTTICDALTKISVQIPANFSNVIFKNSQDFFLTALCKEFGKLLNSEKGPWNSCNAERLKQLKKLLISVRFPRWHLKPMDILTDVQWREPWILPTVYGSLGRKAYRQK